MSKKSSKRGNTGELSLEEAYRKAYESIAEVMENSRCRFAGITCGESLGYMSGEAVYAYAAKHGIIL